VYDDNGPHVNASKSVVVCPCRCRNCLPFPHSWTHTL